MPNLSLSLNNALAGLAVLSRVTETISSNVANAATPGYAPRETVVSQRVVGSTGLGATVQGVQRHVDPQLLGDRRFAEAELAKATVRTDFFSAIERAIGLPDDAGSLSGRLAQFSSGLIQASSRPDSEGRLQLALDGAKSVAQQLNASSDAVQSERMRADSAIDSAVGFINTTLDQIATLNQQITRAGNGVHGSLAIADQRQQLIDGLSEFIPVREVARENGTVALFTPGGAILVDGNPAVLGFTPAGVIVPEMNVGASTLSGLTINGQSVSTDAEKGPIAGGKLATLFEVRDVHATAAQTRLDAVARDLIERFESTSVDPTLGLGDPGLFTDAGAALTIADEVGLSGRISINALVDPDQGGAVWRLRDGIGAAVPGAAGDASILNALGAALEESRIPASGGFTISRTASGTSAELISGISASHSIFAQEQSFTRARADILIGSELQNGVDTDLELQRLLLVEQAFAANAKVISTIDELFETLLRI